MRFKRWLEWEGYTFNQADAYVNGPGFPDSKYRTRTDPKDRRKTNQRPEKMFGFRKRRPKKHT